MFERRSDRRAMGRGRVLALEISPGRKDTRERGPKVMSARTDEPDINVLFPMRAVTSDRTAGAMCRKF